MASIILGMKHFLPLPPPHSYPSFTLLHTPSHFLSLLHTPYPSSTLLISLLHTPYPSSTLLIPPSHSLSLLHTPYPSSTLLIPPPHSLSLLHTPYPSSTLFLPPPHHHLVASAEIDFTILCQTPDQPWLQENPTCIYGFLCPLI